MAKSTSKLFKDEEPKVMKEDAMNLPEERTESESEKEVPAEVNTPEDDIQDIDLSVTAKKRFRINGDPKKVLELNTSDLNITSRLSTSYEKLTKYMDKVGKVLASTPENLDDEQEEAISKTLAELDEKMKAEMDYIFDAPVSEVCCDGGSMYDPFEGMFRFEHIIDALTKLYESNLNSEFARMKNRIKTKTSKYTKKYHN